jgi:hypothetical protein
MFTITVTIDAQGTDLAKVEQFADMNTLTIPQALAALMLAGLDQWQANRPSDNLHPLTIDDSASLTLGKDTRP